MSEFASNVNDRVRRTRTALDDARSQGDDYLVTVHTGELESLARLAEEHDLSLPGGDEPRGEGSAETSPA